MKLPLKIGEKAYESDLNVKFDLSVRDNKTIIRYLAQTETDEVDQITSGDRIFKIVFTADYLLSPRFNLQFFFDRTLNKPHTSRSFLAGGYQYRIQPSFYPHPISLWINSVKKKFHLSGILLTFIVIFILNSQLLLPTHPQLTTHNPQPTTTITINFIINNYYEHSCRFALHLRS